MKQNNFLLQAGLSAGLLSSCVPVINRPQYPISHVQPDQSQPLELPKAHMVHHGIDSQCYRAKTNIRRAIIQCIPEKQIIDKKSHIADAILEKLKLSLEIIEIGQKNGMLQIQIENSEQAHAVMEVIRLTGHHAFASMPNNTIIVY